MSIIILAFSQVLLTLVLMVGWVWNIIKLFNMEGIDPLTGELILRVVGVGVAPLGAIMGYL